MSTHNMFLWRIVCNSKDMLGPDPGFLEEGFESALV